VPGVAAAADGGDPAAGDGGDAAGGGDPAAAGGGGDPVAPEVLATDAGLTRAPAGATDDTMVLPRVVAPDAPAPTGTDDLRAIRGIGRAIERTLHELGITTYRQVADLRGSDLPEAVRGRLEAYGARMDREDWAGQARALHRDKYGD
jgi:predicted flap endonuclease-1-like 5' DNA nuclease